MVRRDLLIGGGLLAAALPARGASAAPASPPQSAGRSAWVETHDGEHLFVKDWRPKDGKTARPLIFVAGQGLPSDMWDYQMVPLVNRGFRCIAYDRRGHGRSSVPNTGYDTDGLAQDLAAVLEAADVSGAVLVGHSIGCAEVLRYMTRSGGTQVAGLVLLATATTPFASRANGYDDGPTPQERQFFLDTVVSRDYPKWIMDNTDPFFVAETPALTKDWLVQMMLRTSLVALYECIRLSGTVDMRPDLPAVRAPALLLHGTKDASTPLLRSQRTAALLPDARLKVYEGAPHGLFLTHAAAVNEDIAGFARSLE